MFEKLVISSPKQNRASRHGWDAFFPYYAGYPTSFANSLISSARLSKSAVILDPWNGSGTTTQVASKLGHRAIGCDLNPVMVVVSRARCLAPADGDSLKPLAHKVIEQARVRHVEVSDDDPLLGWFDPCAAEGIRCIERIAREYLLGAWTLRPDGAHFEYMSSIAATFYVALFLTCRALSVSFQSSNPTWLRQRRTDEAPIKADKAKILSVFERFLDSMSKHLATACLQPKLELYKTGSIDIHLSDSVDLNLPDSSVDFVLTSPPYCTRIDYTAATRIELAVLSPLLCRSPAELSRLMIGSTRVPLGMITADPQWGETCNRFLEAVRVHKSKASSGYYLKTHLDYFLKLSNSIRRLATILKPNATAIFVVQDSYYKDVHNDLPTIVAEMGALSGFRFLGTRDFHLSRSMSGVNPYTRVYGRRPGAVEAVLGFARC